MKKLLTICIAVLMLVVMLIGSACKGILLGQGGIGAGGSGETSEPSGDGEWTTGGSSSGGTEGGTKPEDPEEPKVLKSVYLDEVTPTYTSVGHGSLTVNKGPDGNALSLLSGGGETEYEHGFFAHAYSILVFDELETQGFERFEATIGANKTARVKNSVTSIEFRIYLDGQLKYSSDTMGAYSEAETVGLDITGGDTLTLMADSVGGNGNDHAVWADCKLYYYNDIRPNLRADDIEFASPYNVTAANILANANATAADGTDLSDQISYTTDYREGETGEFSLTYRVSDGKRSSEKRVRMEILSTERYTVGATREALTEPFADSVYYGRTRLRFEARKAYDALLASLLKVDISDTTQTSLTVDILGRGIYIYEKEVSQLKRFLFYDEARLYFIYDWRAGEAAGVSCTVKDGFVDTITVKLYNGSGEYYNGQDNVAAYELAEASVSAFFEKLSQDMSDAQLLSSLYYSYYRTITYSNEKYADGFYGAFILKRGICSGYSHGYLYLAQRMGIQVAYVVGTAGGAHAWNYVRADGKWYMTDTTWGTAGYYSMLGKDDMNSAGRYDHGNYGTMPTLSSVRYDTDLTPYPLFRVEPMKTVLVGSDFSVWDMVTVPDLIRGKAPIVSVTYAGRYDLGSAGDYDVEITARNSLGNVVIQQATIAVVKDPARLSAIKPMQSGNSNYAIRGVSLYSGGTEVRYDDGIYIKANGTITLSFDITGGRYRYFSAWIGIDKVIRDNTPWGSYANATFRIYADDEVLFTVSGMGWKTDQKYVCVKIPTGAQTLKLEVTDTSGQGGTGWGDCTLYR